MDFYRENKIFCLSGLFASGCSFYLLLDIFRKTLKTSRHIAKSSKLDPKSIDQKLSELCVPTPTKLHPYQKKLGNYADDNGNTSFPQDLPGIARSMSKSGENLIFRVCLTGGPSSGKTTAKAVIAERLSERGIRVITVPLTPTLTIENGLGTTMPNLSKDDLIKYQVSLMKMQMNLEDFFTDMAMLGQEKAVILCDRGVMDSQAYVSKEEWQMIMDENDWNLVNLRDRRYDAVIHMVTSANGAEDYFRSENKELEISSKRYVEAKMLAVEIDERLKKAWMGHPHFSIIDNQDKNFEHKMNKTFAIICKFIGLPASKRYMRKFLIEDDKVPDYVHIEQFDVVEVFLRSEEGCESKIRKRGQHGSYTYIHSLRIRGNDNYKHELKKPITARDFNILYQQRNEQRRPLVKIRKCFIYIQQLYVIDSVQLANNKMAHLLRFDTQAKDEKEVHIPPFLKVLKEVSDEREFSSFVMAEKL